MSRSVEPLDDSSVSSYDSDEEYRLAQQEWEESLLQLQQLFSMVLFPFLGKWLGRRWSHWAYVRYLHVGLGRSFFLGGRHPTKVSSLLTAQ